MATPVPTYDPGGSQETKAYKPNQVNADMFGASVGRAMQQAGKAISGLGGTFSAIAAEEKSKDDTARVMEAYTDGSTKLRQKMFDPDEGIYTRTGVNASGVSQLTTETAESIYNEIEATLENDDQKEAFRKMWGRRSESEITSATKHEFSQMQTARTNAKVSALANLEADVVANFNNPEALAASFDAARAMIRANPDGLPQETVTQLERESISKLHLQVLQRKSQESPALALEYYKENKAQFNGGDHAVANKFVDAVQRVEEAKNYATEIFGNGNASPILSSMQSVESSNDPSAKSPKGALGLMQVMPDTAREVATALGMHEVAGMDDKDLHLFFQSEDGQKVNKRLGATYLSWQLEKYDGDLEAALVAYNAGPGNADKWLNADRDYSVLPKPEETKPYVEKVFKGAFGANGTEGGIEGASERNQKALRASQGNMYKGDAAGYLMSVLHDGKPDSYIRDLNPVMQDRMAALFNAAPDYVKAGLGILSGARSVEKQTELWEAALKKYGSPEAARKWVAPPGKSNHNHGDAVDLGWNGGGFSSAPKEVRGWVHANAEMYGLNFPLGHEPWHIETVEARGGKVQVGFSDHSSHGDGARQVGFSSAAPDALTVALSPDAGSASDVYTQFTSPYTVSGPGDLDQMLLDAEEQFWDRPALLSEVKRQITNEWTRKNAALEGEVKELKLDVFRGIMQGQKVSDFSPAMLEKIGAEGVSSLLTLENKFQGGSDDVTDDETYYELTRMDPKDFAEVDLIDFAGGLSSADFKKMADRQASLLQSSGDAQVTGMRTRTQIVNSTIDVLGLKPSKNKGDAEKASALNRMLDDQIRAYVAANGEDPGAPEIQKMIDNLLIKGSVEGGGWFGSNSGEKMVFELTPEERSKFVLADSYEDIPLERMGAVAKSFSQMWGRNPNENEAVDLYNDLARVGLGAAPEPPEPLKTQINQVLYKKTGTRPTLEELSNFYKRMLEKSIGR